MTLTRQREGAQVFISTEVAPDAAQLARRGLMGGKLFGASRPAEVPASDARRGGLGRSGRLSADRLRAVPNRHVELIYFVAHGPAQAALFEVH